MAARGAPACPPRREPRGMSPRDPSLASSSKRSSGGRRMEDIDPERVDAAVLAPLRFGLHDGRRAWKGFDREALDRLRRKGMISNPVGKARSVVSTEEG